MANNFEYVDIEGLSTFWEEIKEYFKSKGTVLSRDINIPEDKVYAEGQESPIASVAYVWKAIENTHADDEEIVVPVTDVRVNGSSVLGVNEDKIADITIPEIPSIPVTDVRIDGQSVVSDLIADIKTPIEIYDKAYNGTISKHNTVSDFPLNGETKHLYIDDSTGRYYLWNGASYVENTTRWLPLEGQPKVIYITKATSKIMIWDDESRDYIVLGSGAESGSGSGSGSTGGEGIDSELRAQFEEHLENITNPHSVTKDQLGLRYVDNTADTDKPVSTAQEARIVLAEGKTDAAKTELSAAITAMGALKVNIADVVDSITSSATDRPLSAKQGLVLSEMVGTVQSQITAIANPFTFKGLVNAAADLPTNATVGDLYQIKTEDKATYAYSSDNEWVKVAVAIADVTDQFAALSEVYDMMDSYEG